MKSKEKQIYLDNNATTRIDPRVLEVMMPFLIDQCANPASIHQSGILVNKYIQDAREHIADLIGSNTSELTFTSGSTEAINLAIKGLVEANKHKKHIITALTEHHAVLDTCKHLETIGYEVSYLPVDHTGLVSIHSLLSELRADTLLVCVMFVNNETGVIQPIQEFAKAAHEAGAFFMTDATQAIGKMPVNVQALGIDLMSFSSHKFYGPKGIGVLYKRNKLRIMPQIHGGGHEKGLRSGTLNVPGVIGFGEAAYIATKEMEADMKRIKKLRDYLEQELLLLSNTSLNGHPEKRLFNVSNICFKGIDASDIITELKHISISNGSACTSAIVEPSHVLKSMGLSDVDAFASIRITLGRFNTTEEIKQAIHDLSNRIVAISTI